MAGELAAFGAPGEVIEEWTTSAPSLFPVLVENWPAVELFVACSTQWRYAGMAGFPAGLDFAGVRAVAAALDTGIDRAMLEKLRILESAAVSVFVERFSNRG